MTEEEARDWLRAAKRLDGSRHWRAHILEAWCDGDYGKHGLGHYANELQQIRNGFGPSWLTRVKGI